MPTSRPDPIRTPATTPVSARPVEVRASGERTCEVDRRCAHFTEIVAHLASRDHGAMPEQVADTVHVQPIASQVEDRVRNAAAAAASVRWAWPRRGRLRRCGCRVLVAAAPSGPARHVPSAGTKDLALETAWLRLFDRVSDPHQPHRCSQRDCRIQQRRSTDRAEGDHRNDVPIALVRAAGAARSATR